MDLNLKKLKNHPSMLHTQEVVDLCAPLSHLDITTFSHLRLSGDKSFSAISTNPAFMENYVKQRYYNADVHADPKHCHLLNCLMWDRIEAKGQTADMLQDAADFQFKHIFTVIQQQPSQVDFYHFGTHLDSPSIYQMYINQMDLLGKFIDHFKDKINVSPTLNAAYEIKFELDSDKQTFSEGEGGFFLEDVKKIEFLNDIVMRQTNIQFTARELSLIPLIVRGLTAKEIGMFLGISYRTVEDYLGIMKHKLRARNKADLISQLLVLFK